MRQIKEHYKCILHAGCRNLFLHQCSCQMGHAASSNWRRGLLPVRLLTARGTVGIRASFVCFDRGCGWNIVYKLLNETKRRRYCFCWMGIKLLRKILFTLYVIHCLHYNVCLFVCFPGGTAHCDCTFHSPVAGFSLLVFEVSWSHTTTRHSR